MCIDMARLFHSVHLFVFLEPLHIVLDESKTHILCVVM